MPSADCAAKVLAAASEASVLSQAPQTMLHPLGAIAHGQTECNSALAVGCQASVSWISPADSAKRFTVQMSRLPTNTSAAVVYGRQRFSHTPR